MGSEISNEAVFIYENLQTTYFSLPHDKRTQHSPLEGKLLKGQTIRGCRSNLIDDVIKTVQKFRCQKTTLKGQ